MIPPPWPSSTSLLNSPQRGISHDNGHNVPLRDVAMELVLPEQVVTSGVFRELRKDLEALRAEIDSARPLSPALVSRIATQLTEDRVHQSNAIEGNTLTRRETGQVLAAGQVIDVCRRRESLEALNLGKAIARVQNCMDQKEGYEDENRFLEIHKVLFSDLRDDIAGRYRPNRIMIRGAKYQPPAEPAPLMKQVFEALVDQTVDPLVLATWCHWAIARIHPFEDGNGRMSRLWQDFILLHHQFTPAIIPLSRQTEYYQALTEADEGRFDSLLEMVTTEAIRTSQTYLNVIREDDAALDWAKSLVSESEQKIDDRLKLEYTRWLAQVGDLREAFRRCVTLLNRSASDFEFSMFDYDIPPQSTWESLRSEPRTPQTWCFRVTARTAGRQYQYTIFTGKHFRNSSDSALNITGPLVNLLVSEKCGPDESPILMGDNSPVRIREILIMNGELVIGEWDPSEKLLVYRPKVTSMNVAQQFFEDVIRHRLTT